MTDAKSTYQTVRRAARQAARAIVERPPANARRATYADVIEGRYLTLIIDRPGIGYALRCQGGPTVPLPSPVSVSVLSPVPSPGAAAATDLESAPDESATGSEPNAASTTRSDTKTEQALRFDLTEITGLSDTWQAQVLADGNPVWVPVSVGGSPVLAPPAPEGHRRFRVSRSRRGVLTIEQIPIADQVPVLGFGLSEAGIELQIDRPGEVLLAPSDAHGTAPIRLPVADGRVQISAADLPSASGELTFELAAGGRRTPLARRANDLERPGSATVLPALYVDDRPLLRLRFREDGTLVGDRA